MLVLFDQSTPAPLRAFLREHQVETAYERGWDTLTNGELLKVAESAGFQVFVTPDKNIRYQQNLREPPLRSSWWGTLNGPFCAFMSSGSLLL
jgi:hypothetical protein